jgi:hypothetical protein
MSLVGKSKSGVIALTLPLCNNNKADYEHELKQFTIAERRPVELLGGFEKAAQSERPDRIRGVQGKVTAMSSATATLPRVKRQGVLRHSRWDALLVALAFGHGAIVFTFPLALVIALGVWWGSNTIAHNFIHKPFFRGRALNRLFGLYLSVLLGIPQTLWRDRHLAHHAGVQWRFRWTASLISESLAVLGLWAGLLALAPAFFLTVYLPGLAAGLLLCWVHGFFEHVGGGTISHYGPLYNLLFFNDGYHVEHHERPGTHWTKLARRRRSGERPSRWPAVLRWLDTLSLNGLERMVLKSRLLQRFVLRKHEAAFRSVLSELPHLGRVAIVGGGLFPRTALILARLLPGAELTIIDADAKNIEVARRLIQGHALFINEWFDPDRHRRFDLIVIPLAYIGSRSALYRRPPAPFMLIHDWIWHWRPGAVVSWWLCKRLNVVRSQES